jgi:hypothetical protein
MAAVFENILIMILTIVVLLVGGYLVLAVLGWGLKVKSGSREQEGLTRLWAESQTGKPDSGSQDDQNGSSGGR